MKLVIAGGTGLVGQAVCDRLKKSHDITIITRNKKKASQQVDEGIQVCEWRETKFQSLIQESDVVINLAGENIGARYWTRHQKARILSSRVTATERIVASAITASNPPRLINASAIGIYGFKKTLKAQKEHVFTEISKLPSVKSDFLTKVGQAWENALQPAIDKKLTVVGLRFGVILSPKGGMLKKLLLPYKLGLGGRIGSGQQLISWVALADVVRAIEFMIERPALSGVFNIVAPDVVSQEKFARTLAKSLHRPAIIPMPTFLVKWLFGEMGDCLLLNGHLIKGEKIVSAGFHYQNRSLATYFNRLFLATA